MNPSPEVFEMLKKVSEGETVLFSIVSVKDLARNKFQGTRTVGAVREAVRDFKHLVLNDPQVKADPADFELYQVGIFNPGSGRVDAVEPVRIARGVDFLKSE